MVYSKAEKELIEVAKEYYLEHGAVRGQKLSIQQRIDADIPVFIQFYHDMGLINDKSGHDLMWSILKKAKGGTEVITHEEVSKSKAKAEEEHLVELKIANQQAQAQAVADEIAEKEAELEKMKKELEDARKAKLETLEAQKAELEKEKEAIEKL